MTSLNNLEEQDVNEVGAESRAESGAPARRKMLAAVAGIGLVSAMPREWSKPLVNTVLVPAHATTSPPDDGDTPPPPPPEEPTPPPPPSVPPEEEGCSGFETEPIAEPITN